jgi:hypothetical protein
MLFFRQKKGPAAHVPAVGADGKLPDVRLKAVDLRACPDDEKASTRFQKRGSGAHQFVLPRNPRHGMGDGAKEIHALRTACPGQE